MKRKQLLALALVIAMMIGMMPVMKAKADDWLVGSCDVCHNPNWYSTLKYEVLYYDTYEHYMLLTETQTCDKCGYKKPRESRYSQPHNYGWNNVCSTCGYSKNACTHEGENWRDVEDHSVVPVHKIEDGQYHREFHSYKRYCKDCNQYVKNVTDEGTLRAHQYDYTGSYCTICWYSKPVCTHANRNWNDVYDSSVLPVYRFENEQNHRVFNSYKRYCKDCNTFVKNVTDDGVLKAHNFTNGDTCICGYKKPVTGGKCQHVGESKKIDTEYSNYGNATTHQRRDVYGYTCSNCSETVIDRYTEWTLENHKDSGQGWCLYCGATVEAAKDWESLIEGDPAIVASTSSTSMVKDLLTSVCSHSLSIKPDYIELNATFHLVQNYIVCSICGMEELIDDVSTGIHDLDYTGKCTVCEFADESKSSGYCISYSVNGMSSTSGSAAGSVTVQKSDLLTIEAFDKNGQSVQPNGANEFKYSFIDDAIFVCDTSTIVVPQKSGTNTIYLLSDDSDEALASLTVTVLTNTVSYKGNKYTVTSPAFTNNNNDYLNGWRTVGTEVIDVKKKMDWAGWIGDFEAMEVADPGSMSVPDYKSQNSMQSVNTSSGLSSLGKVGKIGTGAMFAISAVNDALEHYTVQTMRIVYQENGNERRAILEVGSNHNGNRAGNSYSYVQWILDNATAGNPLTYTYGLSNMVLSPHSIVNKEVRKVFTDYDLKDNYYYDFQFEYSKEWSADPYYAYISQNEHGEWGYTLRIKEGDVFRLRGIYQSNEHIIDLTEDMAVFIPMSSEGAKEIESILQQAK